MTAFLGNIRAGATPVPLDVQFDDDALLHVLDDSRPRWILANAKQAARLDKLGLDQPPDIFLLDDRQSPQSWQHVLADASTQLPEASSEDKAVLFYTLGTTGPPTGIPLTHQNVAIQLDVLLNADLVNDGDCLLLPLPLHHVYPLVVGLLTPLARGLSIVLPHSLSGPQMVFALNEGGVTIVIGVPRLYRALVDGIMGKAESSGRIAKACFRLAMGISVFGGYRNLPDKTDQVLTDDGWFHTGDLGFVDDDGFLYLTGRKGTMIVTESGENVQPDDVENAYAKHSAIREIGVLGQNGRRVALIVPETSHASGDDLKREIEQAVETQSRDLPSYQRLAQFRLTRESLPRTRLGKIQRHKLRERFA